MDFDGVLDAFHELQIDSKLHDKNNLHARAEALENLSFITEVIRHNPQSSELAKIADSVRKLKRKLNSIQKQVFEETRAMLKSPNTTQSSLRTLLNRYTNYTAGKSGHIHVDYEALDVLINGTLFPVQIPPPQMALNAEMVHWEASPGSVILDMVDHVPLQAQDVLVDMGSGLGNIAILVNMLCGIKTLGIEREPAYYQYAVQLARELSLDRVCFVNCDARKADLSVGTVFYFFTPFMATILHEVLANIHRIAQSRPIYICSFGPCTPEIAQLSWLRHVSSDCEHEFKLAVFKADERSL